MRALAILIVLGATAALAGTTDDAIPDSRYLDYASGFAPYTAFVSGLEAADGRLFYATGVAIHDRYVVTAAHVASEAGTCLVTVNAKTTRITRIFVHAEWQPGHMGLNDIAIMQTAEPIGLAWYPPLSDGGESPGDVCQIAGFGITSEPMATFRPSWWEGKADANVEAVADEILAAVAALVTAGNYGDTANDKTSVALATFGRKSIAGIRAAAVKRKMRTARSVLCLNPDFFSALLGDLDANVYGGREAIQGGTLPGVLGFRAIVEIPQYEGPGFLCHPSAIAVASRKVPLADEGPYKLVKEIVEPETGLVLTNVILAHGPDGSLNNSVTALYGVDVGDEGALLRLV
jgi:hypothetical protein